MSTSQDGIYQPGVVDPGIPVQNPTKSFWHSEPAKFHQVQSTWLENADIVIIGSGITATSIARTLYAKRPDLTIVLLEARDLCSGATGQNSGHIKVMSYNVWLDRKRRYGVEEAVRWTKFEHSHLAEIGACVKENEIDCELELQEGVDVYYDGETFQQAIVAIKDMQKHAPNEASQYTVYSRAEAVRRFKCADICVGAIGIPSAAIWPYKLVSSLIDKMLKQNGLSVQTNTRVLSIKDNDKDDFAEVRTDRGSVFASHVIHATNGWIGHLLPELRPFISPVRGNVTRQVPPAAIANLGNTFWIRYSEKDYDYLIQRPTGDLIIGRANLGRNSTGDDSNEDILPVAHLGGILPKVLDWGKSKTEVTHRWSGILGFT